MKQYKVIKPLYNERAGRTLQPGEMWPFDDRQAAVLIEAKCITREPQLMLSSPGRLSDPELDQLSDL